MVNTIGHAVLIENIKMAAYYLNHSNGLSVMTKNDKTYMNEAKSCYMFVQGTGLDITINEFDLSYSAHNIRRIFNYCIRHSI